VADVDPAFVPKIFYIPERQLKSTIQHHRESDDIRPVLKWRNGERLFTGKRQLAAPAHLKPISSETAL